MDEYSRKVELYCPTCGCTQFSCETPSPGRDCTDDWEFTCVHCGRLFTREQLKEANTESINAHIEDMGDEIMVAFEQELKKQLKKSGWDT
jgi:transposase-like protein